MIRDALISLCGKYRYWLRREWDGGSNLTVVFVMLNPSTADAEVDDPTVRRCIGFAQRMGAGELYVINVCAYRATDPRELDTTVDPVGIDNHTEIEHILGSLINPLIIAAWGAHPIGATYAEMLLPMLGRYGDVMCLTTTKDGHPRHPLYLPKDAPLQPYRLRGTL